jgi:putative membrane protein
MRLLLRLLINAAALWLATRVITGLSWQGPWTGLVVVALVFGVVNAIIRPLFSLFTFPFLILSLGLFTFVTNALMLWLTSLVAQRLGFAFTVVGFWPAVWGALLVTITSGILSFVLIDDEEDDDD